MNIYLIGMPGAGKSTIGKALAKQLNYRFIDLDHEIERNALMFIDEIFEKYGEETFRNQEKKALSEIQGDHIVISTGGGIVKDRTNKQLMQGIKVYIDTDITLIEDRIEKDYPRPLLKNKSLDTLYQERMLNYVFFADLIVSNDGNIEQTTTKLIQLLKEKFNL
jgi:shikimate kinase